MSEWREKREQSAKQQRMRARLTRIAKKRGQDIVIIQPPEEEDEIQETQIQINQPNAQQDDKQQKQEQNQQEQKVVQKIDTIQKDLQKIKKTLEDPLGVYNDFKKGSQNKGQQVKQSLQFRSQNQLNQKEAILQSQQIPDHYFQDTGIVFSRRNYIQIVRMILQRLQEFNLDPKPYRKYLTMYKSNNTQRRLYSTRQLQTRLKFLYGRYKVLGQYYPQIEEKLYNIQSQLQALQSKPRQWLKKYMITKLKLTPDDQLYKDMLKNKVVMQRQVSNRKQLLQKMKQQIMQKPQKYARKKMKNKLNNIQKLQQLIDIKGKLHQQQKTSLVFLIDSANQQVIKLQQQIKSTKQQYQNEFQKIQNQNNQKIQKMKQQENELKTKIDDMSDLITKQSGIIEKQRKQLKQQEDDIKQKNYILNVDQQRIKALTIQNINLRQQLQQSREKQRKILNQAYIQFQKIRQQNTNQMNNLLINFKNEHDRTIKEKEALLNQKVGLKEKYVQQLNNLQKNHFNQVSKLKNQMQKIILNDRNVSEKALQQRLTTMKQQYIKQNNRIMKYMQGRQVQFRLYQQKKSIQFNQLTLKYEQQLQKLIQSKGNQDKQKQQQFNKKKTQLQLKIKSTKQKSQKQISMIRRVLTQNKQQSQKLITKIKQQKDQYEKRLKRKQQEIEELRAQKQKYINQLQEKITKIEKEKKQEEQKKLKALRQKEEAIKQAEIIKKSVVQLQLLLKKYTQSKIFITSFKRWKIDDKITIRQCFKQNSDKKWIATTRGINYSQRNVPAILATFEYWDQIYKNKNFPLLTEKSKIKGTNLVMILDIYKEKKYYSIREYYYYNDTLQPTRRGFNISQEDLQSFFANISQEISITQISNDQRKYVDIN